MNPLRVESQHHTLTPTMTYGHGFTSSFRLSIAGKTTYNSLFPPSLKSLLAEICMKYSYFNFFPSLRESKSHTVKLWSFAKKALEVCRE